MTQHHELCSRVARRWVALALSFLSLLWSHTAARAQQIAVPLHVFDSGPTRPERGNAPTRRAVLQTMVDSANHWFAEAGVCFFVEERERTHVSAHYPQIRDALTERAGVNVAIVPHLIFDGRSRAGVATTGGPNYRLALNRRTMGRWTLAHELGHVFGLEHTSVGVMSSGGRPWALERRMSRAQRQIVQRNAARFVDHHGRRSASRCARRDVPDLHEIESGHPVLRHVEEVYESGAHYAGESLFNRRHGYGRYAFTNGETYEGHWRDSERHGEGTYWFESGSIYRGDWHQGKRHGHGEMHYASGNRYVGAFRDGKRHGRGVMHFASGNVVEGNYRNGERVETIERRPPSRRTSSPQSGRRSARESNAGVCGEQDRLRVGDRVRLHRHSRIRGGRNWNRRMGAFVGRFARVQSVGGVDRQGCRTVRVDIDDQRWSWREVSAIRSR